MENRQISEKYTAIGKKLIEEEDELDYIKLSNVSIIFLQSDTSKKKSKDMVVKAECEKISDKYKWGIPCDFTITVFEPNVTGMTDDQIKILLFHELLHIGIDFGDDGEKYFVNPHDLEDFKIIIDRFGVNWDKVQQ